MDTNNLFVEQDIVDLFKISSANIKELVEQGEVKPVKRNGKTYYVPAQVAVAVSRFRKANKGDIRAEYR